MKRGVTVALLLGGVAAYAGLALAQFTPPPSPGVDTSGLVRKVANVAPDMDGNVTLPSSFSGITMTDTTFFGGLTVNGKAPVLSVNGTAPVAGDVSIAIPSIAGLATVAGMSSAISSAVAPMVTLAGMNAAIASATSGLATTASVTSATTGLATTASVAAANSRIDAISPYARTKWAGQNLSTNSSGIWTGTVPAGRMAYGLSVSGLVVHTAAQFPVPLVTAVGSPAAGYTVTVTFTKAKQQVTVPAVVVGAGPATLALFEAQANTGVVSFDIGFAEPDVIGS